MQSVYVRYIGMVFMLMCVMSPVFASTQAESLQQTFNQVADTIYPAVVSITTVQAKQVAGDAYYLPYDDKLFDTFLGELFGFARDGRGVYQAPSYFQRQVGIGSGIILSDDGYILTNYHLIEYAEQNKVTVKLSNGEDYAGIVSGVDAKQDLAIIKINAKGLAAATLADSDAIHVGDWAIAIGNPYGFVFRDAQPTMTVGVVSALNRTLPGVVGQHREFRNLIQTDASINLGNSGGPLVNIKGEVMGVNVAIVSTTGGNQGIGFAIPSNQCKNVLAHFVEGKQDSYSWLGIEAQSLNDDLRKYFKVFLDYGVVVMNVIRNSPAYNAGIREGDILVSFSEQKIANLDTLLEKVEKTRVGDEIFIEFIRQGEQQMVVVTMDERPQEVDAFKNIQSLLWCGLRPADITQALTGLYNLPHVNGVVITDVLPGSNAEKAGLIEGDVILKVNDSPIKTVNDFYASVGTLSQDVLIKTIRGYFVVSTEQ